LVRFYSVADGLKTGYTGEAGFLFVMLLIIYFGNKYLNFKVQKSVFKVQILHFEIIQLFVIFFF